MAGINEGEREFEVGKDEAWFANVKRTYDEYQQSSLESDRRNRVHFDKHVEDAQTHVIDMQGHYNKVMSDAQSHDNQLRNLSLQAMQNAIETANMVGKQAVDSGGMISKQAIRHSDLAIDREWNPDEVAILVANMANTSVFKDAIAAAVAKAAKETTT